jgi:uncharacterized membrane protein
MTVGVLGSALCFGVAIAAELLGDDSAGTRMVDVSVLVDGLLTLLPAAWASLGTYILIVAPVVALVATGVEYLEAGERATTGLAVMVLVVLLLGCLVAVAR